LFSGLVLLISLFVFTIVIVGFVALCLLNDFFTILMYLVGPSSPEEDAPLTVRVEGFFCLYLVYVVYISLQDYGGQINPGY
jgi:hypothetical protein